MTFVYIVRCNFTEPAKEQAWNAWYSGPKIEQMLAKPYFRTCQRFRIAQGTGRRYLALWTLQSPEAFNTAEYTSDWGAICSTAARRRRQASRCRSRARCTRRRSTE
jgi:hypothetical protein